VSVSGFLLVHRRDPSAATRASDLLRAGQLLGLQPCARGQDWALLTDAAALSHEDCHVVGKVFDQSGNRLDMMPSLTGNSSIDLMRTFVGSTWGQYLAVVCKPGSLCVMADPSGVWPLWMISAPGLTIVTDCVTPSLLQTAGVATRINPAALAATLVDASCAAHLTFLDGVTQLLPGRCYDLLTGKSVSAWNIAELGLPHISDPGAALHSAVHLAASRMCDDDTVVQLSGGLDSAIVLSTLAASGRHPKTMNFATSGSGGDERGYARLVAERCETSCVEVTASGYPDYRRIAAAAQGGAPNAFGLDAMFEDAVDAFATTCDARSVMTGQGGDAVFFQPATPLVTIDRARAQGFGKAHWPALLDDARRSRSSIWHHLLPAVIDRWRPASVPTELFAPHLLTAQALREVRVTDLRHPWLVDAEALPPGKRMQIAMIANSQIFHRTKAVGVVPQRHPLLAQPVLEATLGIPTHVLACGNNDRGLARRVFADGLPDALIERRTKGDASDHYSRAALANLDFLRDYLLGGRLVALGILDGDAMASLLTREGLFHSLDYNAVAMQVSCEAWVRAWTSPAQGADEGN
jgi:asparagine synthase (glutamine-hydrolysing)